ncbi:hypothetical protein M3231_17735 [Neobacillus mesonae]|nr:hypothetical protein [Neobacillus mesonae]
MLSSYSVQLTAAEAAFLFQLMDIPEGEALLEYAADDRENIPPEKRYELILKDLKTAGLLAVDGKNVILDSLLLELLKACKYSCVTPILQFHNTEGESSIIYGFLSGAQAAELKWCSETGEVILTSLLEGLEELVSRMGDTLLLPDTEEKAGRLSMYPETFNRIKDQQGKFNLAELKSNVQSDALAQNNPSLLAELMEVCSSCRQQGMFEVIIRGTELCSHPIYFMGSPDGNWIFIKDENREMVQAYQVTEPEFIQTLYLVTTRTLSILTPS